VKIRTAEQYRRVLDRRDEQAARARRTRWTDEMTAWDVALGEQRRKFGITQPVGVPRFADPHIIGQGSKPNHAARAVSIDACFPLADSLLGTRPAHPGKETKTAPMTTKGTTRRSAAYHRQHGCVRLTPRQMRRLEKKYRRTLRPTT
jgi:hypothetical protein